MTKPWWLACGSLTLALAGLGATWYFLHKRTEPTPVFVRPAPPKDASEAQVRQLCGSGCHAYPPPDSFPRSAWRKEVEQGFFFAGRNEDDRAEPSLRSVVAYYENRAPLQLPMPVRPTAEGEPSIRWQRKGHAIPGREPFPEIVNVNVVRLTPKGKSQVLVCECDPLKNTGKVLLFDPQADPPSWKELATLPGPVHTEVVDLDGDGHSDILVACLGHFFPSDDKVGSVVWLRGRADGTFEPIPLLTDVGRVTDVRASDFDGDGKLDLVVAVFGWRKTGSVLLLENRTTDWSKPTFVSKELDGRHGAINVEVADLNKDGKPDIVALFSQEHECVVAFLNQGGTTFRKELIYAAPHPAFGSSGIQLVDLDGDGDLDVLYTNGDVLDKPFLVKPYHGVHWLENRQTFPFTHHRLANMPGAMRAVAGDIDGDGDQDILVVSYLPADELPERDKHQLDAVLWLEQDRGKFRRRPLETGTCDHFTCALGDLKGDGRLSLLVGNFWSSKQRPMRDAIGIWSFAPR